MSQLLVSWLQLAIAFVAAPDPNNLTAYNLEQNASEARRAHETRRSNTRKMGLGSTALSALRRCTGQATLSQNCHNLFAQAF